MASEVFSFIRKWRVDTGNHYFDGLSLVLHGQLNRYHPYPLAHQAHGHARLDIVQPSARQDASQSRAHRVCLRTYRAGGRKAPAKPQSPPKMTMLLGSCFSISAAALLSCLMRDGLAVMSLILGNGSVVGNLNRNDLNGPFASGERNERSCEPR